MHEVIQSVTLLSISEKSAWGTHLLSNLATRNSCVYEYISITIRYTIDRAISFKFERPALNMRVSTFNLFRI